MTRVRMICVMFGIAVIVTVACGPKGLPSVPQGPELPCSISVTVVDPEGRGVSATLDIEDVTNKAHKYGETDERGRLSLYFLCSGRSGIDLKAYVEPSLPAMYHSDTTTCTCDCMAGASAVRIILDPQPVPEADQDPIIAPSNRTPVNE